jgi:predicted permease
MVPLLAPELWIAAAYGQDVEPVGMHDTVPSAGTTRLERRGDRWMFLRGRLKPGKTIDDARANLDVLMSHLATEYASTNGNRKANLRATNDVHLHPAADGTIVAASTAVAAVVGVVLLIACANVASMLLARASSRQKEIGIRLALGASRARLVRQLVTEAFVMSALGAVGGIALTYWLTSIVASINLPLPFPLSVDLHVDGRVLVFTLMVTAAASLIAGLIPAIQASKPTLGMELRAGHGVSRATRWMSDGLVGGQMVLTAVLLIVAGLLTRTLIASYRTNVGFPVERLAVVSTDASMLRYSPERTRQFYDEALARVTAIPGVKSVALATRVPFSVNFNRWEVWVEGHHRLDEHGDPTETTTVSPEYFSTIGVPIVEGRGFTASDRPNTPLVAVVNEAMARRYWPGESAVGKIFHSRVADGPQIQIVGVAADYKVLTVSEPPTPFLHISRTQRPGSYAAIIARTGGDASALLRDMRRELLALEPNLVFVENQTMSAEVEATLLPVRAGAMLVSVVGGVAMLLAAIGLYGVIAYSVARRTREIGIRLALGAQPMEVLKLVMREGLAVALAGLVVGCLLATLAVRAIAGVLYGVRPGDPVSWLAASAVLLGVSALANLIPAWRAARVDPSIALRTE